MALMSSIDTLTSWEARGLAFLCGIILHIAVFRKGEWNIQALNLVADTVFMYAAATASILYIVPTGNDTIALGAASSTAGTIVLAVLAGLYSSILTYRAAFHRLNRFPGPFLARLSNIYQAYLYWRSYRLDIEAQKLHQTYGDVVRIGPSELSLNDPKALQALHSSSSTCMKGPWYNVLYPSVSVQAEREHGPHAQRRKAWDHAFSSKALRDYQPRVAHHTDLLLGQLLKREGEPVNVTDWFTFYAFDVMGSLSYSESFGMLERGKPHYYMTALHGAMKVIGLFSHLGWLFPVARAIPILNREDKAFWNFVVNETEKRIKAKLERPDIFSWVLSDYNAREKPTLQDKINLYGDAFLITIAGSDTTSATLTCLFFELCTHPDTLHKLRQEVDEFHRENDSGADTYYEDLHKLKYLQACINETLRLHPPVARGVQRMTPPEGLQVGDYFIPGDTIVQTPTHTMFRDPRYFSNPDEFIPERWTTRRELVKDASVFVPFSMGPFSCVGKQLALMEIRHVTSQIVRRWLFGLSEDQTADAFRDGTIEAFTMTPAPLNVVFTPRERVGREEKETAASG